MTILKRQWPVAWMENDGSGIKSGWKWIQACKSNIIKPWLTIQDSLRNLMYLFFLSLLKWTRQSSTIPSDSFRFQVLDASMSRYHTVW
jgi:hypothetical protein